jgi:hypothetical protein
VTLETVDIFRLSDVRLVGGSNTIYTCDFMNNNFILNISEGKTFRMENGILRIGKDTSSYFSYINNEGKLELIQIEIEFSNHIGYFIYITNGGTITFEYIRINNEIEYWEYSLIYCIPSSSININFTLCSISNCTYNSSIGESAFVHFNSLGEFYLLNIINCSFENNTFNFNNGNGEGSIFQFYTNTTSRFILFFIFYFFFFFFFFFFFLIIYYCRIECYWM